MDSGSLNPGNQLPGCLRQETTAYYTPAPSLAAIENHHQIVVPPKKENPEKFLNFSIHDRLHCRG